MRCCQLSRVQASFARLSVDAGSPKVLDAYYESCFSGFEKKIVRFPTDWKQGVDAQALLQALYLSSAVNLAPKNVEATAPTGGHLQINKMNGLLCQLLFLTRPWANRHSTMCLHMYLTIPQQLLTDA
jgi:hypothetical protein